MLVLSCSQEFLNPESRNVQPSDSRFSQVQALFEAAGENISIPHILSSVSSTKGIGGSVAEGLLPDWSNCCEIENDTARIFEVPLSYGAEVAPFLYSVTSEGDLDIVRKEIFLQSHLVIQQFKSTDSVRFFITTVVGNISDSTFVENQLSPFSPWHWSGDRRGFRGYQFITDLGGELKVAYSYRNSTRREVSFTVHGKSSSCPDAKNGGFGFFIERHPLTKGYDECPVCWTPLYGADECPFCGYLIDELYIIEEGYTMCSMCFRPTHLCDCPECIVCLSDPCLCEDPYEGYCPFCWSEYCSGECINMGGGGNYNPGNGEDTDVKYRVTVSCDGNGSVSGAERSEYTENVTIMLQARAGSGSVFGGWVDNGTGELLSISESMSVLVDSHKDYTAHFYLESSECGRLVKKYKNNGNLRALVEELNNFKTNAAIEHAVLKNVDGEYTRLIGNEDKVEFSLRKSETYEYIIHNHPSGSLIPSPEDLYTIYKADSAKIYSNEACFLIQTNNGTLSIEIEDKYTFEVFALGCLMTEEVRKDINEFIFVNVLGKPTNNELLTKDVLNKVIAYYSQHGLKFAYTDGDGQGKEWSYAKVSGTMVTYNDCI